MFANPPKNHRILFIDMNAFFASCEQQVRPELRGQPVGVAPYTGPTGCIIARSYEAKPYGIKTGTSVGDAKRLCPHITILESRPALYHFYHKEIVKVLNAANPIVKPLSIDEFALFLKGSDQTSYCATQLAITIKETIRRTVGDWLRLSAGIGPNIFLAKMAAESQKPDGLTEITLGKLPIFYQTLSDLIDITGISHGMSRQLQRRGFHNPSDFFKASQEDLRRHFGMIGLKWYFRLRGWEVDDNEHKERQIGHQHVLAPEYRTRERAYAVLIKLAHKAGKRLRAEGFFARGFHVGIRFLEGGAWEAHSRRELFQDQITIARLTQKLFGRLTVRKTPLMVRVTLFDLERSSSQPISLFEDDQKQRALSQALDQINDDFGPMTIHPAASLDTATAAPDRIPFGRVRYEIGEY